MGKLCSFSFIFKMKSVTNLQSLYGSLSQNTSATNLALGLQIMNDEHRYLLQKYFNNEGSYTMLTVGPQSLTLTATPAISAISATLTVAWAYYTTTVQVTFSSGDIRPVKFIKGSTTISWDAPLTAVATTAITTLGLQFYPLPPNYSKLNDLTITNGQLVWTPQEILTRRDWDLTNTMPYSASIPTFYYIYPGGDHGAQVGIWPIPSTTGYVITFNYKYRVPDLSIADYTTPGTVSIARGATALTGTTTSFAVTSNQQLESRWIQFSPTSSSSTTGDNLWYQIASVDSATAITLYQPYQGTTITASSTFTIGQMPIINEDFHDMLVYKALTVYFSSIVDNPKKRQEFQDAYDRKLRVLDEYLGTNSINVNLRRPQGMMNPNLFQSNFGN